MDLPKILEPQFELIEHFHGGKIFDCFRVKERKEKRTRELLLRLLPPSFNNNQAVIDEFHGFFLKLSNLTNRSHIPIVYSVAGTIGGPVYVLEQHVSGVTLPEYIERHRSSNTFIDDLTEIVVRVCEGLHFSHQKDISHCCITPDDILIDPDNTKKVKLIGFGAEILLKTNRLSDISASLQKFIAPEISSGELNPRGDIYSLAMALSDACPEMSLWNDLLARSQSRNPMLRPSSAREFGRELRKLADTTNERVAENESGNLITGGLNPVLNIKTEPEGAEVWANGRILGVTTASGLMTSWKRSTILEIRKTGYSTETLDLSSPPDNTEITIKLKSAFKLYTNPWGAVVKANGFEVGVTSRDGLAVPWAGSTIEIEKAGYKPEILRFVSPPKEHESSVELQPEASFVAPKRHILEVIGYAMGAIVLWLLPLVIYSGVYGRSGSSEGRSELIAELNYKRSQISRLKSTEIENKRLSQENLSLKAETEKLRKEYSAQNQIITTKDQEIGELRKSLASEKLRGDTSQQKLMEKEKEISILRAGQTVQQSAGTNQKDTKAPSWDISIHSVDVYREFRDGPVLFPHTKHKAMECDHCHHEFIGGLNLWEEGRPVEKCSACHPLETSAVIRKLEKAYHDLCAGCHKKLKNENGPTGPVTCAKCHQKKQ